MKWKVLRQTVRTYTDHELEQMARIARWSENIRKQRLCEDEIDRRVLSRRDGTYTDETLKPSVHPKNRLSIK